ncbi:MAG: TIGR03960 family B12-binding radical SAM protein, partial [Armatimonadetes bacterium]|nr:TIGR03960 family B12-binding radical SAM protein [Armatimonadota bacterium]
MEITISDLDVLLSRVVKPARYTDGEWNAAHKDPASVRARMAFVYPDVYDVGMSHLGLQILYHVLNSHDDFLAERAFAPWPDMEQELRARNLPLTSLESRTPLGDFDAIGITLPYELTYSNILNVLDLAGVPLRATDRSESDPLVIGGGPGAVNPEPLADFFDAILIGEGEEAIVEIAEAAAIGDRREALAKLAAIPGVYVPSAYDPSFHGTGPRGTVVPRDGATERILRRVVEDLDAAPFPTRQIVPFLDTVHSRATLEIMRGCTRGCRFCQAGSVYRPRRQRSAETLLRQAEETIAATGYDEISLLSFTSVDYLGIEDLAAELVDRFGTRGVGIALPSLRADAFSVSLANTIQRVRKTGLTFAPEAGTARLRRVIGKRMQEDELF